MGAGPPPVLWVQASHVCTAARPSPLSAPHLPPLSPPPPPGPPRFSTLKHGTSWEDVVGKRQRGALKTAGGGERNVSAPAPILAKHLDGGTLRISVQGVAGEVKSFGKA